MIASVLIAGVGNVFLGDDGFGPEVARRMSGTELPPTVRLKDFGISSLHLAFELLEGYDALILIDAAQRNEAPGTVSLVQLDTEEMLSTGSVADAHTMSPSTVVKMLDDFGGRVETIYLIACEPESVNEEMALSPFVDGAIPGAIEMVRELAFSLVDSQLKKEESK